MSGNVIAESGDNFDIARWQSDDAIKACLGMRRIAMVGLSSNTARPSNQVAQYLLARGYAVIPVNPQESMIMGLESYPDLASIPFTIDLVDVFRDSAAVPQIARDAVAIGAKGLWLQLGVISQEGVQIASEAGLTCIMDRCPKIELAKLTSAA